METILTILIPITFVFFFVLERVFPARPLPAIRGWALKGFGFFVVFGAIATFVPALVAEAVASRATPLELGFLGTLPGAVAVLIANEIVAYPVHRGLHWFPFIWRWTHQMHHSAERHDVAGSVYFHPFDVAVQSGIPTLLVAVLGVTPDAAALGGFVGFVVTIFQHLNVKTPRWLGFVVLRPEQHSVHHARGVHAYNYGNFAFMDLIFGTFRNPPTFAHEQGFWNGASSKMGAMLLGRDVSEREAKHDVKVDVAATP